MPEEETKAHPPASPHISARLSEIGRATPDYLRWAWQEVKAPRDLGEQLRILRTVARRLIPSSALGSIVWAVVIVVVLGIVLNWYSAPQWDDKGIISYPRAGLVNPILGGLGALFLIYAAIRQSRTASYRHTAQTKADLQRRITETFSKAVEQLASERAEVCVGGIYTLERLALEVIANQPTDGADDPVSDLYWTIIETLTAFVRERARWKEQQPAALDMTPQSDPGTQSDEAHPRPEPATDIATVLEVIRRRPDAGRAREKKQRNWRINLRATDLRGAYLWEAHLEDANLFRAHLEGAFLAMAHLERANIWEAHLEGTDLFLTYLEGVDLARTFGDSKTRLPETVRRPAHWPRYAGPN
jgi:hypothetical protein